MGLDYGSKTVGVAVSDLLGMTAQPVETITRKDENKLRKTCARIEELIKEYEVGKIVLGLPKHMNDPLSLLLVVAEPRVRLWMPSRDISTVISMPPQP